MPVDWNLERQKLNATYNRVQNSLNFMKKEARRAGTLSTRARWSAQQPDELARARALPLAAQAYNARISAEASRFETAYFLMAQDLRERGLETANVAMKVREALKRQPLITAATTNLRAADIMDLAAANAGQAAREMTPPLDSMYGGVPAPAGGEMQVGNAHKWRPRAINELMSPFYPPDVTRAAGALGALGRLGATTWWEGVKKALGVGVAAAGSAAAAEGQRVAADEPAAGAAVSAGGGTLQWLSTLLGAEYQEAAAPPAPSASIPWGVVAIGVGVTGVLGYAIWSATSKQ